MPIRLKRAGVFVTDANVVQTGSEVVDTLKEHLPQSPAKRSRFCAHRHDSDAVQEMIIVLDRDGYVRPHRHHGKSESFHVIEGEADVVIFNDDGSILEVIPMGPYGSGKAFFYRINAAYYHTPVVRTRAFVMHEVSNGPFVPDATDQAPWAPEERDASAASQFMARLREKIGGA